MKLTHCCTAATFSGVVKVGLPDESKKLPPFCLDRTKTLWMFSGMLAPSTARP